MADLKIDLNIFFKRIKLMTKWLNNEKADVLVVINGNDTLAYSKTLTIHQWLFGYCLPNSAFVLSANKIHVLASKKVGNFLKPVIGYDKDLEVIFNERNKSDDDKENIISLRKTIETLPEIKCLGHLAKDNFEGKFFELVKKSIKEIQLEFADLSSSLANLFAIKDTDEINKIKKASQATAKFFEKSLKESILNAIDVGKKVKHSELAASTEKYVEKVAIGEYEGLDVCYPPIIQSGGKFNLKFSVESDENNMHMGVIICSMGLRCDYYCSNIIRTLMINATKEQKELYEYLVENLYTYALEEMQPGKQFSQISKAIEQKLANDKPQFAKNLLTSFGFSTGVEFKERFMIISNNTNIVFKKNMAIIFYIGLQNLECSGTLDKKAKTYSIWVGDTIIIGGGENHENREMEIGGNLILTNFSKRRNKYNLYQLKDDSKDEGGNNQPLSELENYGRGQRRPVLQNKVDETMEEKRRLHQETLYSRLLIDCDKRLSGVKVSDDSNKKKKNHISYKTTSTLPKDEAIYNSHVYIDKRNHTALLYPNGYISPFHMSIIKNASHTEEGDRSYLRINFNQQGLNALGKTQIDENTEDIYLKEITIKTSNMKLSNSATNFGTFLINAYQTIKEEQRRYKTSEVQAQDKTDLVQQDHIMINPRKEVPKLKDLYIRPTMSKSRVMGNLECHQNGLRFATGRTENIDILFNNIKHAFFQPCEKEMIVLIHFHLFNPIMYNKKKQKDIQFYTEVGELTTDLGKMSHMQDRDDFESEQREKDMRRKLNDAFSRFCSKVDEISNNKFEFDQPFRKLAFMGCPHRSTVFLQPTTSCLVQLTEWPPFLVTLDEIELVFFERVNLSNKSFDMIFIFKDYNEKPVTITSLPQDKLDDIKNWLNNSDIYYSEGGKSLNWVKIMKNITDDPKKFLEDGGWAPLVGESDGEEEEEDMDDDGVYAPSDSDDSEDSDDDSAESGDKEGNDDESDWDAEESDGGGSESGSGSDESKGMDWDDLEEQARKADRETEMLAPPPKKKRH